MIAWRAEREAKAIERALAEREDQVRRLLEEAVRLLGAEDSA